MRTALLLIDIQNDYFPEGRFPLWDTASVIDASEAAILGARRNGIPVVIVQHVSTDPQPKLFGAGTHGVEVHPRILAAAPHAPVVVKRFADSFHQTTLEQTLRSLGAEHVLVGGMMTQNCVTHTVLSPLARHRRFSVLADCTTTIDETVHAFALNALSTHFAISTSETALS